jgi:hypothetical protein
VGRLRVQHWGRPRRREPLREHLDRQKLQRQGSPRSGRRGLLDSERLALPRHSDRRVRRRLDRLVSQQHLDPKLALRGQRHLDRRELKHLDRWA